MLSEVLKQVLVSTAMKEARYIFNIWKVKKGRQQADLQKVNLERQVLSNSCMKYANLESANLKNAHLQNTCLAYANLRYANLKNADLRGANLEFANLEHANLDGADLEGARLEGVQLHNARLYGTKGLPSAEDFLAGFEKDENGILVWKRIGPVTFYSFTKKWSIKPGAILKETVNPDRGTLCAASGIQFETKKWADENYLEADLWKCRIRWAWLTDVVVPFGTDGRARTRKLELIEIVNPEAKVEQNIVDAVDNKEEKR